MTQEKPETQPRQKKPKQKISDRVFYSALTVLIGVSIPTILIAIEINQYGVKNAPKGYRFPQISQFWMTLLGAVIYGIFKNLSNKMLFPLLKPLTKKQANEEAQIAYTYKAIDYLVTFIYFTMSSVWGYHTLKNSPWLPWYLGGQHPEGSIE